MRNYAKIEKELLAIVFGAEKLNQYTYGRKVTVESDHFPIKVIYRKPLVAAPSVCRECYFACRSTTSKLASSLASACTWQTLSPEHPFRSTHGVKKC